MKRARSTEIKFGIMVIVSSGFSALTALITNWFLGPLWADFIAMLSVSTSMPLLTYWVTDPANGQPNLP